MARGRRRALAGLGAAASLVALWRPVRRVEVKGDSMVPTLHDGDRLLALRLGRPHRGDLVVLSDPRQPSRLVVKRVVSVHGHMLSVAGDNPEHSTDSRTYGPVPVHSVLGRVVRRYGPPERAGRVH